MGLYKFDLDSSILSIQSSQAVLSISGVPLDHLGLSCLPSAAVLASTAFLPLPSPEASLDRSSMLATAVLFCWVDVHGLVDWVDVGWSTGALQVDHHLPSRDDLCCYLLPRSTACPALREISILPLLPGPPALRSLSWA
jgi:hypothetical protein